MLGCNNFEIIDLGVMVPMRKIVEAAKEHGVDAIGLSGLITPSLDEMVYIARELEREGLKIPLLIGGATTSKVHTAVKIEPEYSGPTIHVLDASKSVPAVSALTTERLAEDFVAQAREEYVAVREQHAARTRRTVHLGLAEVRANAQRLDFEPAKTPETLERVVFEDYPISELRQYIDWTPFFIAWEMKGKFPRLFDDAEVGAEARKLYDDAQTMLDEIEAKGLLEGARRPPTLARQ